MGNIEASDIHKRHIGVTLRLLEQTLMAVERAVIEAPPPARLIKYSHPIPEASKSEILAIVDEVRREIRVIADDLNLPQFEEDITRVLLGNLHARLVNVVEMRPRWLRGGGEVAPSLAHYIEPKSLRLESLLRRLIALLGNLRDGQ
jgi:hypothetical protein